MESGELAEGIEPRRLEISDITHSYDGEAVLTGVSLTVSPGESMSLLGPSGCGKTTLLRVIAGLERPSGGTIRVDDQTFAGAGGWTPPEKRNIGLVFQDWALFPHLDAARNVAYGLPKQDRGERVAAALELVGLADMGDRMPATLSGGQQQRLALARALAPRPGVLLLDEPFSNLDSTLRVQVRTEVRRLLVELGITAVFVTHDQEEAFVVGDRVAVMRGGEIVQVDTPQTIYSSPVDRWTAEFLGAGFFVRDRAVDGALTGPLAGVPLEHAEMSGPVDVLLRPEQLELAEGSDAVIELVEFPRPLDTGVRSPRRGARQGSQCRRPPARSR